MLARCEAGKLVLVHWADSWVASPRLQTVRHSQRVAEEQRCRGIRGPMREFMDAPGGGGTLWLVGAGNAGQCVDLPCFQSQNMPFGGFVATGSATSKALARNGTTERTPPRRTSASGKPVVRCRPYIACVRRWLSPGEGNNAAERKQGHFPTLNWLFKDAANHCASHRAHSLL
jgi:hypothetical protein